MFEATASNLIFVDFKKPVLVSGNDRVLLRSIWEQLQSNRQYTNWVDYSLKGFELDEDYGLFNNNVKNAGRPTIEHWVTVNTAKELCMMSRTEEGKKVRQYFIECERLVYENNLASQLKDVQHAMNSDLLFRWASEFKRLEDKNADLKLENIRLEKTKAEISDKKTATAMATASVAVRQKNKVLQLVENLKVQLGEAQDWATAVVAKANFYQLQGIDDATLGKMLAKKSRQMKVEVRKKPAPTYPNGIGIYHISVIKAVLAEIKR